MKRHKIYPNNILRPNISCGWLLQQIGEKTNQQVGRRIRPAPLPKFISAN
jgi:hypothetical protein